MQVYNQDNVVQSVLSSAVSTVMGSHGSLLGTGALEVSPLLSGGLHLIDTWVELEVRALITALLILFRLFRSFFLFLVLFVCFLSFFFFPSFFVYFLALISSPYFLFPHAHWFSSFEEAISKKKMIMKFFFSAFFLGCFGLCGLTLF